MAFDRMPSAADQDVPKVEKAVDPEREARLEKAYEELSRGYQESFEENFAHYKGARSYNTSVADSNARKTMIDHMRSERSKLGITPTESEEVWGRWNKSEKYAEIKRRADEAGKEPGAQDALTRQDSDNSAKEEGWRRRFQPGREGTYGDTGDVVLHERAIAEDKRRQAEQQGQ